MNTFHEYINEVQNKIMQYMQSLVPNWPIYVVNDLLYSNHKNDPREVSVFLKYLASEYGYKDSNQMQWKLEDITIIKDIFDDDTQRRMMERGMGQLNPYMVPNDTQRHQGAATRLQQNPNIRVRGYVGTVVNEPIIIIKWKNGKYALLEGWHRTMQMILAHPEGYQQKAYVLEAMK